MTQLTSIIKVLSLCGMVIIATSIVLIDLYNKKIKDITEEYETAIEEMGYHTAVENAQGYYYNYDEDFVLFVYPQANPRSRDRFNPDTLIGFVEGDTVIIVPINL